MDKQEKKRFEKALAEARKWVPEKYLKDVKNRANIFVAESLWRDSAERNEQINAQRRTPKHVSLLRFVRWYLKLDSPPNHINREHLARAEHRLEHGHKLAELEWITPIRQALIDSGEYVPESSNLKRDKAPWG